MYSLFIDTLSSPAFICLFDDQKNINDSVSWAGKHAEFDTLIESIDLLICRNCLEYKQISALVCIVGPGGFTGIRVTTLVANTIGYSYGIPLYSVTLRDFFQAQNTPLPWILPLTKTEVLVWRSPDQVSPDIIKKSELFSLEAYSSNQSQGILEDNPHHTVAHNYSLFLHNFHTSKKTPLLHPIYARDPNVLTRK